MSEKMELAEAGLRHADGLTAQLDRPHWVPSRAHIEQARNSIKKLAEMILASSPAQEPVTTEPDDIVWSRVNSEPFEYAIQQGPHGDEFVKLINGKCLRRSCAPLLAIPAPPQPGREVLRKLVDIVWNEATESKAVPSTKWADRLIDRALTGEPK